ncbi:hypothetical protein D3C87_1394310 [compost metagenome]
MVYSIFLFAGGIQHQGNAGCFFKDALYFFGNSRIIDVNMGNLMIGHGKCF